ncbi:hypothetical protein ILUMI_15904 [Ignelater luminosus]|uniref:Uncharacterized protein n=1 Tax=Ignelater luminosus TaxID=2038154 RepID=A0A8K0CPK4_IGNLU|nr:hypothetical protein ILUMI_15904 [Ignelater luminosus]
MPSRIPNIIRDRIQQVLQNHYTFYMIKRELKKENIKGKHRALFVKDISKIDPPTQRALSRKYSIGRTTVQREISRSSRKKVRKPLVHKLSAQIVEKRRSITKPIFVNAGAKINSKYYQQNILTHYEKELGRLYPNNDSVFHQDSAPSHQQ